MAVDEQLLEIERERLEMEKRRDRHATQRFIIGSVLVVLATSGASLWVNHQQQQRALQAGMAQQRRALEAAERQWVIPTLLQPAAEDFDSRLRIVERLLALKLSSAMKVQLEAEKLAIIEARTEDEARQRAQREAVAERKRQEALAEKAAREAAQADRVAQRRAAEEREAKALAAAQAAKLAALEAQKQRESFLIKRFEDIQRRFAIK